MSDRDEWQPISTAPKDGNIILLGRQEMPGLGALVTTGYWLHHNEHVWIVLDDILDAGDVDAPTHWRPLPPPPKGDGE